MGVFESSLSPALILFTAQWYRKKEQGSRTGIWASFVTWGGILGALIAYGLFTNWMKGKLLIAAWRALFIILGAITILLGVIFFFIVPDTPQVARFLNPHEREIARLRTAENMQALHTKDHKWYQVREAFKDPAVWIITAIAALNGIPNGGITNFYAIMVLSIGVQIQDGILLSMLNCWVAVATIITLVLGSKFNCRTLAAIPAHIISMLGRSSRLAAAKKLGESTPGWLLSHAGLRHGPDGLHVADLDQHYRPHEEDDSGRHVLRNEWVPRLFMPSAG